ncbi:MAG TPA: hypothetical protein DDY68_03590 [Porphyromonadaceae bacterium]|nr:hypothetical protein [Porphyromonadaceae bacterium]
MPNYLEYNVMYIKSKYMITLKKFFLLFAVLFVLTSCDEKISLPFLENANDVKEDGMVLSEAEFSEDYKEMRVYSHMREEMLLKMFQNNITVDSFTYYETDAKGNIFPKRIQPKLISMIDEMEEEVDELNHKTLLLVDLTLSNEEIEKERECAILVKKLYSLGNNLYVSFMYDDRVTECVPLSDYVIENYFRHRDGEKFLYRSILNEMKLMSDAFSEFLSKDESKIWEGLRTDQKMLLILSDGKVYDNTGRPIDPDHYTLQQELMNIYKNSGYADLPIVCYVDIAGSMGFDKPYAGDAKARLTYLCHGTRGEYYEEFNMSAIPKKIIEGLGISLNTVRLVFEHPDGKAFRGDRIALHVNTFSGDSVYASGKTEYSIGSIYKPIIINGDSVVHVIVKGLLYTCFVLLLAYVALQLLYPYISYQIFKKKYVLVYTGTEKGVEGNMITKTCYYCKGEFKEGDQIVAKCPHTVHLSCWNENGYMCPEHGPHCKQGAHFYNSEDLFDGRNASVYLKWVLCGTLAGLFGWLLFLLLPLETNRFLSIVKFLVYGGNEHIDSNYYKQITNSTTNIMSLPYYGVSISFFLSLLLGILTEKGKWLWKRLSVLIAKAIVGGVIGYLSFIIGSVLYILFKIKESFILIDAASWAIVGIGIAYCVTFGSKKLDSTRALRGALVSVGLGLASMYLWALLISVSFDTREFGVFSYLLYSIGLAVTIAFALPKSSRYFLHVEGPIKTMDLALFKWMNVSSTEKKMTIGMSVDCDLQMNWDLRGYVAQVHAEVLKIKDNIYLVPLAKGVRSGRKQLKEGSRLKLKHGVSFIIGETKYTYIEKDL